MNSRSLFLLLPLALAPAASVRADPAPPATEQAILLDPFQVTTGTDNGYSAINSNSITRFNAEMDKLPIAADIFDQTFMDDVGATSVEALIETYSGGAGFGTPINASSLTNQPDPAEAHEGLGICYRREGRLPDAVGQFEQAVSLEPDNARSHENLGATLARMGQPESALREHEAALGLKSDYPEARNNLGIVLAELGRIPEAQAQFEWAVRLRPNYAEAKRNLAQLTLFRKAK